ncbi:hypothetical protein SI65_09481 [Aspergillus cristatus]|uniref:Uncharacterized protein n=1 Tax=Aspergillus cristatus TaxID=573508 RepID=A0A1E3B3H0_ASPCR|nr:hypothetical protein SI65_09481 [Aspergillus cristatus]
MAIGSSKLPLVTYLLNNGANPNANRRGETNSALETAAISASPEIVQLLLKHGAEICNRSALHKAASYGHLQICRILIDAGDDVNAIPDNEDLFENTTERDDWGTPLHGAAGNGHTECVRFLLEKSARRDVRNPNGLTPGEVAQRRGHTECAALLV